MCRANVVRWKMFASDCDFKPDRGCAEHGSPGGRKEFDAEYGCYCGRYCGQTQEKFNKDCNRSAWQKSNDPKPTAEGG